MPPPNPPVTPGRVVIRTAATKIGNLESRPNRGTFVDMIEAFWGMVGKPYCGMGADYSFRAAFVDDDGICHPATAVMYQTGHRKKREWDGRSVIPAGSIWVKNGVHTALIATDVAAGSSSAPSIGFNESDGCRWGSKPLRGPGIAIFIPKAVADGAAAHTETRLLTEYWVIDDTATPVIRGPWSTTQKRDAVLAKLKPATRARAERVTVKDLPALRIGRRKAHGPYASIADARLHRAHLEQLVGPHVRTIARKYRARVRISPSGAVITTASETNVNYK